MYSARLSAFSTKTKRFVQSPRQVTGCVPSPFGRYPEPATKNLVSAGRSVSSCPSSNVPRQAPFHKSTAVNKILLAHGSLICVTMGVSPSLESRKQSVSSFRKCVARSAAYFSGLPSLPRQSTVRKSSMSVVFCLPTIARISSADRTTLTLFQICAFSSFSFTAPITSITIS